jgi:hypothetical protein
MDKREKLRTKAAKYKMQDAKARKLELVYKREDKIKAKMGKKSQNSPTRE